MRLARLTTASVYSVFACFLFILLLYNPLVVLAEDSPPEEVVRVQPSSRGERIVQIAREQIGTPYSWGGASPEGFDCAGLAWYVFQQAGIDLGTRYIPSLFELNHVDDPQPGDILFFVRTYKPGLSHVGIYSGDGKMIHAAGESWGVIESSIYLQYWYDRYAGAVRP